MLRLLFAFLCAAAACMLVAGALTSAQSPATATPDAFLTQVTHASGRDSSGSDISANGRFVVFESTGDVATLKPEQNAASKSPNNTDGNIEVFLYDYAQRRIFQLTDTRSVPKAASSTPTPSPSPSPSATPTASPSPTPLDLSNVQIEINSVRPMISLEPTLASGQRTYTIVFSSNAPNPGGFNGVDPGAIPADGNRTLATDANQEIWTYTLPAVTDVDLTTGADIPYQDLSTGAFARVTATAASRAPSAGSTTAAPFVADDNRDASISDDGTVIAFASTRDLVTGGNVDTGVIPNPEVFIFNRGTLGMTQVTNTKSSTNVFLPPVFNANPCIAGSGSAYTVAFVSNANITGNNDDGGGLNNAEVFSATYNGAAIVNGSMKQVTRTKNNTTTQQSSVVFGLGRRLSRDGRWIALESLADDPKANVPSTSQIAVTFVYDNLLDTFTQVGPRAPDLAEVNHFPTFTNYSGTTPGAVVFTSALNFKSDGTFPAADQAATGLNPGRSSQIFITPLSPASAPPVQSTGPFTRLTNITATSVLSPIRGLMSASSRRFAFSIDRVELGGGNSDFSGEVFYQLSPPATTSSTGTVSLFTGASLIPVAVPVPSGSPAPSPSPSGSPGPLTAPGLAAGEVGVINSGTALAPSSAATSNASESQFAPSLPIELNGVSVSISGVACGLYSVAPGVIKFVVPPGIAANTATGSYSLVINNNGTVIRGLLVIVAAQPDVETPANGPNGRAVICNITVAGSGCILEPFNVTTPNASGTPVPTILEVHLTGVRGTPGSGINVIIGTTTIAGSNNIVSDLPGFDLVVITLPATVDRGDNLPVVVRVGSATSRPTPGDAPPLVKINPSASPSP
jgi:uncharacterized protein (TIGR03437 family)